MTDDAPPPSGGPPGSPPGNTPPGGAGGGGRRRRRRRGGGRGPGGPRPEVAGGEPTATPADAPTGERVQARPLPSERPQQPERRDERGRPERPRHERSRHERPRDARPRDERGRDERSRDERPRDERGRRDERPRPDRRDERRRDERPRQERAADRATPPPRPKYDTPSPAVGVPPSSPPSAAPSPTTRAPLLSRPSAELDAGWGVTDEPSGPIAPPVEAEVARTPTPPPVREPRDPDGEDVFVADEEPAVPPGTLANVAGVKFRDAGTIYEFDAGDASYPRGERVVVESERGPLVGTIAVSSRRLPVLDPLRRIVRRATPADEKARDKNAQKEREAYLFCKQRIRERGLPMKLVRVEYPLSSGKVLFYFASDERVDFRELVKDLASRVHARIEMRQIGARDEAKMVGGIGSCGRELCCSTWLPSFVPVSIKMAKDQGLVLNPSKVSGQCGRLKCCLVYEHDLYKEMRKGLPKVGKRVQTPAGTGKVVELDVLRQRVRVWFDEGGSEVFPPDVLTVLAPPPQPGKRGQLPVVPDEE